MSRKPKTTTVQPEPAATPPVQTPPETTGASQAAQPESTLGDGDATGAATMAPEVSTAPAAPTPDVENEEKRGPEGYTVLVTGPAKGRWRIGRHFGPDAVAIPATELTEADMEKLANDPELVISVTEDEA